MSKAELLEEITKLTATERIELWDALWALEERELLGTTAPTDEEKELLDLEWKEYLANPEEGSSWAEVKARLRERR